MAITKVGTRYRGEKIDRVVDSLGSSADGTNTGITRTGGKIARPSGASWDFTNILYSGKNYDVSSKENQPATCTFKTDGTKFYVVGEQNATIYEFTCSTAWDVSTASYTTSKALNKTTGYGGSTPQNCGIAFKSDGLKCFVCERNDAKIHEYALSTAWDISTLNTTHTDDFSASSQTSNPRGIWVNSDGTKFYLPSTDGNDTVYQYTCSTGWDLSTASYASKSKDYSSAGINNGIDFAFNNDGTKCYVLNISTTGVYQFTVDTAYDVTTIDLATSEFLNTSAEDGTPLGFYIEPTQKKIFIVGLGNDKVSQYSDEYYGAYSFDGTNDKVATGDKFGFLTQTGSIAFWMKPTTFNDNDVLFDSCNASSSNSGVICKVASASNLITFLIARGGSSSNLNYTFGSDPSGKWTHLAFTYDGTTAKIYENGSEVASGSVTSTTNTPTYNLHFGEAGAGQDGNYDGLFDDIGIWNRVLTATEISALVNKTDVTPTKSNSNFGSWTTTGSQVTESNNVISFDITTRTSTHICSQDLGSALSDDKWVLRGKLNYTTLTGGGGSTVYFEVGIGSSATATIHNDGVNLDFIGLQQRMASGSNDTGWGLVGYDSSGSLNNPESPTIDTDSSTGTDYYFEIKRTANNSMSIGIYNSSSYDTLVTGMPLETKSIATSITGLRYLRISNGQVGSESSTGNVIEGTISDLKVWNDTTEATENTGALVSSLTNKSGLKAYYTMDGTSLEALKNTPDYTFNFSSNTDWTQTNSGTSNTVYIDTSAGHIRHNTTTNTSSMKKVYYNLEDYTSGSAVNDSKWTMRFKWVITNQSAPSSWLMALSNNTNDPDATNFNGIGVHLNDATGSYGYHITTCDGSTKTFSSNVTTPSNSQTLYFELKRTSATNATLTCWSDSYGGTQVGTTQSLTIPSGVTSLKYLQSGSGQGGNSSRTMNATLDDLEIFDDSVKLDGCKNDYSSTSSLDALTGIKSGSVFLQTDDTPKYYWYDGTSWKIDGTTAFLPSGSGLHVGGSSSNTSTFTATDYVWASSSVSTIGESRSYSAGAGNKNSFWIAGGSNAHTSRIFDGSSWSSTTALDTERRDTTAGGGSTSNAIIACGRNQSGTEISSSSKYNGTSWSSAGTVTGGAGEHVGGSGTASSFLATGGSTRNDKCDKYDGTSWSASAVLPQTTVRSHNQAGKSSASAHTAGGNYASSFTWDGTSWATSTNYTQGGDTTVRYPTGGGTADHHWLMGGLDETGGTSTLNNTELWNGSSWTAKGALPTGNYAGLGDGSDF